MDLSHDFWKIDAHPRKASAPGIGPYYWLPNPAGAWTLAALVYPRDRETPDHDRFWKLAVSGRLVRGWDLPGLEEKIRPLYYAVPRGRVSFFDGIYYVNHGNDAPVADWLDQVKSEYRLSALASARPDRVQVLYDPHERMNRIHTQKLIHLLGKPESLADIAATRKRL